MVDYHQFQFLLRVLALWMIFLYLMPVETPTRWRQETPRDEENANVPVPYVGYGKSTSP